MCQENGFVWWRTIVTVYGARPTYAYPRVLLFSCPKLLVDLAITPPTACLELFSDRSVAWHKTVHLRIDGSGVCRSPTVDGNTAGFSKPLESARELLAKKKRGLGVEIFLGKFLLDTDPSSSWELQECQDC